MESFVYLPFDLTDQREQFDNESLQEENYFYSYYRTLLKQLHNYLTIAHILRHHCNVLIVAHHHRLLFGQTFPPHHRYTADTLDNFPPLHTVPTSTRSSLAANRLK